VHNYRTRQAAELRKLRGNGLAVKPRSRCYLVLPQAARTIAALREHVIGPILTELGITESDARGRV
jgi:hypothetical protein